MRNLIPHTFGLTLLVTICLLLLSQLPAINIGNTTTRKVDILSDIRITALKGHIQDEDSLLSDSILIDSCKNGLTCIEDYADSVQHCMDAFYEALCQIDSISRPVRIAYLGDSFIEGDILTVDLRSMLQERWGGNGVGWVDITSQLHGFRPSVFHHFSGWTSHSITDSTDFNHKEQGLSSRYFIPSDQAYIDLRGKNYLPHLDTCEVSTLYLKSKGITHLQAFINGKLSSTFQTDTIGKLQAFKVEGNIGHSKWQIFQPNQTIAYGVAMEGLSGISVDNFSLRGSSGLSLLNIPLDNLRQFANIRPYDLLILQYGLNVANERQRNYEAYCQSMQKVINHLKQAFPKTSILVIGISDRAHKDEEGNLRTMSSVKNLIHFQRKIAQTSKIAFWNLFDAMGGEGSISEMVATNPPMANQDYTHINFHGGKKIASILYETLMYGYEQYERRKKIKSIR